MATVHLGRLLGPVGFSRTVAIKRLHEQFASDPEFVAMFLDEARLAARVRHPNVVPTLDVVATGGELFLVMEYVPGESLSRLARALRGRKATFPLRILSAVMAGVLHGLHAAHEAKDEHGHPLHIVHRDVSPQNVLVGTDGVARVLDFGIAKAAGRIQTTREGQIKGKLSYMAPEQLRGAAVSRASDVYSAGVMLWELVTGQRLYSGDNEGAIVAKVLAGQREAPSKALMRTLSMKDTFRHETLRSLQELDVTILRALASDPHARFATARELAIAIERQLPPATGSEVADWLAQLAGEGLESRAALVAEIESRTSHSGSEPPSGYVQSVLAAAVTLSPNQGGAALSVPALQSSLRMKKTLELPRRTAGVDAAGSQSEVAVTQPSSISARPKPRRKRTLLAGVVGFALVIALPASIMFWRPSRKSYPQGREAASAPLVPAGDPAAAPGAPLPPSTVVATPTTRDAVDAATSPIASLVASSRITPPSTRPSGGTQGNRSTHPDCSTPYWFDDQNVKHYKAQCFEK